MADTSPEVLFVDDEDNIRMMFPMMLQSYGFKVTAAASVAEALRLIGDHKFDVLISDLNISRPGDGFALVNAMRNTQPNAVRFILTGYPDFESALNALREEVDDYLIKPTEAEEIAAKIHSKLQARRGQQSRRIQTMPLSKIINREQDYVIGKWLELAKQDAELSRVKLSDSERRDHLPQLLGGAIGILEGKELTAENRLTAAQHGQTRFNQGYSPNWLFREAKLFQDAISGCIQRNLLEINISTLIPDMVRAFGIVQTLLEDSLNTFLQSQGSTPPYSRGMIQLLNIVKIPHTEPQRFRLHFKNSEANPFRKGYQFENADGTESEIRERLKNGGMNEAEIDVWFAQVK